MRHTFYALFRGRSTATAAVSELARRNVETMLHDRKMDNERLELAETNAMPRLVTGILVGVLLGPLLVLGILTVAGLTISAPALVLGAVLGAVCCGLGGMLMGAGAPDQTLERLAKTAGPDEVIVTVVAPGYASQEAAAEIVHRHEGTIADRGVVTSNPPEAQPEPENVVASQEQQWEDEGGNVPEVPTPRTDADATSRSA
jgi:hypothetical protein